ncbi:uncharacterized protein [Lolium perenne]|uniref:uncharacterized protein n=1 Tax=Lolium perenne TaxID=4522 RepID=UPI0021F6321F|nr:uncharacterized protein LOC127309901 [Lolium perenne]
MIPSTKLANVEDDVAADAVSKVLGDDDLLAEILLRVGFPTTLVRAAAACKRWLHHASDKAFLRRFRKLNPPRSPPRDTVYRVRGAHLFQKIALILSREEKDGGLSYFYVMLENPMVLDITSTTNFTARVFILKDGVWCMLASATTRIDHSRGVLIPVVLVDNKIYMVPTFTEITVLDLATSSFSTIQLPLPRVPSDFMISHADDASSVYLVRMKEDQLCIWLHKGGNWSVVDTFSLNEMCANLMMSDWVEDTVRSERRITHLGDNAEFVLLQRRRAVLYLDTRRRTLRRLYEVPEEDEPRGGVVKAKPFMMIWPPTFPALKSDPARFAFWPSDN